MRDKITEKEMKLAARVDEIDALPGLPGVGGVVGAGVAFLLSNVSRGIIAAALVAFIGFHGWKTFNTTQQLRSDLLAKQSEAGKMIAEAAALNEKIAGLTNEQKTRLAEMQKMKADADAAQAEADAATHSVDGVPARLAQLRAELAQKQADARSAKADAGAALQDINGVSLAVAQKQAEVDQAESKLKNEIISLKILLDISNHEGDKPGDLARRQMERSFKQTFGQ